MAEALPCVSDFGVHPLSSFIITEGVLVDTCDSVPYDHRWTVHDIVGHECGSPTVDDGRIGAPLLRARDMVHASRQVLDLANTKLNGCHCVDLAEEIHPEQPAFERLVKEGVDRKLGVLVDAAKAKGRKLETSRVDGNPGACIAEQAEKMGADLIVIGTHGRHGFQRVMLGSVAERVLRLSPVPVLAVR